MTAPLVPPVLHWTVTDHDGTPTAHATAAEALHQALKVARVDRAATITTPGGVPFALVQRHPGVRIFTQREL